MAVWGGCVGEKIEAWGAEVMGRQLTIFFKYLSPLYERTDMDLDKMQNGESILRHLQSSAEAGYRPRDCPSCGRRRMSVCFDGRLRCEKCNLDVEAKLTDLADVFGSVDKMIS